jgi:hypothetical protein
MAGRLARSPTLRYNYFVPLLAVLDRVSSVTRSSECRRTLALGTYPINGQKGLFPGKSHSHLRVPDLTFSFRLESATVRTEGSQAWGLFRALPARRGWWEMLDARKSDMPGFG